ncbi:MerR family DNA-binding transcriptional regulator [Candidatus Methylacidithermus pantelleriae]|uniref:MerR family DNA-binding transcriptional regulator n=1 Tax=Candidatus Methylacidithermus pantelleriae TaxID=2744239 RepID=UPI0038B26E8C
MQRGLEQLDKNASKAALSSPKITSLVGIGEAAYLLGASIRTLRLGEAEGPLLPRRTAGGHRR